jgi:hypothetical protein
MPSSRQWCFFNGLHGDCEVVLMVVPQNHCVATHFCDTPVACVDVRKSKNKQMSYSHDVEASKHLDKFP